MERGRMSEKAQNGEGGGRASLTLTASMMKGKGFGLGLLGRGVGMEGGVERCWVREASRWRTAELYTQERTADERHVLRLRQVDLDV